MEFEIYSASLSTSISFERRRYILRRLKMCMAGFSWAWIRHQARESQSVDSLRQVGPEESKLTCYNIESRHKCMRHEMSAVRNVWHASVLSDRIEENDLTRTFIESLFVVRYTGIFGPTIRFFTISRL